MLVFTKIDPEASSEEWFTIEIMLTEEDYPDAVTQLDRASGMMGVPWVDLEDCALTDDGHLVDGGGNRFDRVAEAALHADAFLPTEHIVIFEGRHVTVFQEDGSWRAASLAAA